MTTAVVLLDANVLYSAPLRDILLQLAFNGLFQARWSAEIEGEWKRNLLANRPELSSEQIETTQSMMRRAIPDALVTNFLPMPELDLPDPDDRHIVAAAVHCAADAIVTFNTRDFPAESLKLFGFEAIHPDQFLQTLIDSAPLAVIAAARSCRGRLSKPAVSAASYLTTIRRLGLPITAAFLEKVSHLL